MRTKTIRSTAIAAIVALGLVAGPTEPAHAGSSDWELTAGEIEVRDFFGLFPLDFDLADPPEDLCTVPAPPSTIDVEFDDPDEGDIAASMAAKARFQIPFTGNWYQADITASGTGTYEENMTPPPDFDIDLTMDFDVDFYAISPPNNCEKGTPVCHWDVDGAAFTGGHEGTVPPSVNDTVTLDSVAPAGIDVASGCASPFDVYTGGTVEVSGLVAVFQ